MMEGEEPAQNGAAVTLPDAVLDEVKSARADELREELQQVEQEVNSLKQVLLTKQRRVTEIKKELGITPLAGLQHNVKDGITRIGESPVVQKTNTALKAAGEKTSAAFSSIGKKLDDVKNSEFVKSFEEKVTYAYDHVKNEWTKKEKMGAPKPKVAEAVEENTEPIINENASP